MSQEKLSEWYELSKQLKEIRLKEMDLRKELFGEYFPDPIVGTNKFELNDGWVLKGTYSLTYSVDNGAFTSVRDSLRDELEIPVDSLVEYKPSLVKREYNRLTEAQLEAFNQVLIVKPSSPAMEIVLPKKNAK